MPWAALAAGALATGLVLSMETRRRPFLRWMPEPRDVAAPMPGDGLLEVEGASVHAIEVLCRPAQLWPWLVQMGYGRAGWYSHDRLDNWGHRSAERIVPEWQRLERKDLLPSTPKGNCYFEVLDIEKDEALVLGAHLATGPMRSPLWDEPSPRIAQRATWAFALIAEEEGVTRLRVRSRAVSMPPGRWLLPNAFFSLAHVIMQRKQLLGLKRRAEGMS